MDTKMVIQSLSGFVWVVGFFIMQAVLSTASTLVLTKNGKNGERVVVSGNEEMFIFACVSATWPISGPYLYIKFRLAKPPVDAATAGDESGTEGGPK